MRIPRLHAGSVRRNPLSGVCHNPRGCQMDHGFCHPRSCPSGWSQLNSLAIYKFWLSVPHLPPRGMGLLAFHHPGTPSPIPCHLFQSRTKVSDSATCGPLSDHFLFEDMLLTQKVHSCIHSFIQQTFIDTFIICHLLVLGTWNALMNRRDKNPCPPGALRCS